MAELIPQEVRELAAGIADDIERLGHHQGEGGYWLSSELRSGGIVCGPDQPCCIVQNRHWLITAPAVAIDGLKDLLPYPITEWNDETPTADVLATLRKIAAGEKP